MAIILSPKHGVNPCVPKCFVCGENKQEIILFGRLRDDQKAPHGAVIDKVPCDKCISYMEQGVIIIVVKDGEDGDNPSRTGHFLVIKEDAAKGLFGGEFKGRIAYVEETLAKKVGLITR